MKFIYEPLPENGPTIEKYHIFFNAGDVKEVTNPKIIAKMKVLPFFKEVTDLDEGGEFIEAPKKKRGRPRVAK
jgi:hypothetical protein